MCRRDRRPSFTAGTTRVSNPVRSPSFRARMHRRETCRRRNGWQLLWNHVKHYGSDGTTLLGADDKAGVAEIMSLVARIAQGPLSLIHIFRPARGVAASGFPPLRKIPHCCLP